MWNTMAMSNSDILPSLKTLGKERTYTNAHIHATTHMHMYTHTHTHAYTHTHACIYIHINSHAHTHICTCIQTHTHTHTRTCTHTHTHAHTQRHKDRTVRCKEQKAEVLLKAEQNKLKIVDAQRRQQLLFYRCGTLTKVSNCMQPESQGAEHFFVVDDPHIPFIVWSVSITDTLFQEHKTCETGDLQKNF